VEEEATEVTEIGNHQRRYLQLAWIRADERSEEIAVPSVSSCSKQFGSGQRPDYELCGKIVFGIWLAD